MEERRLGPGQSGDNWGNKGKASRTVAGGGDLMAGLGHGEKAEVPLTAGPKRHLITLREKIEQQRNTIRSLKRGGHDCPDAERQLHYMLVELRAGATRERSAPGRNTVER